MKDRLCCRHTAVPAIGMCIHCHKPYCQECQVETPFGKFCCFDCSGKYAAFKTTWKEPKLKFPWLGGMVAGVILLAVIGEAIAFVGNRWFHISSLAPFDLVSRFLP